MKVSATSGIRQSGTKTKKNAELRKNKPKNSRNVPLRKLFITSWKYQGKIFFVESTLHGVKYIAETDRPIIERLIWLICVMIGAISTMVIIVSLWDKFQTNPTITGLDTDFHNWDIPFPAVSVCPSKPWNSERLEELVQKYPNVQTEISIVKLAYFRLSTEHNLDSKKEEQLGIYLQTLTQLSLAGLSETDFPPKFDYILQGQDLNKLALRLMNTCKEYLKYCRWKTEEYDCCAGFIPVFTEDGFCFTFNSFQNGRKREVNNAKRESKKLLYIKETDAKWSLQIFIDYNNMTEVKIPIYLHNANELPGINLKPQHIWDMKIISLSFSMKETYTTKDAQQLSIKQRHCIYDHEMKLSFADTYTYTACAQECRMNNARRECSCIPHFYDLTDFYAQCNISQLRCIAEKKAEINNIDHCVCELGCSNTVYEVDKLMEIPPDNRKADEDNENPKQTKSYLIPGFNDTILFGFEVEFTSWPMIKYKREVLFGWVDLLVSFGGIAGLFLGFSLLSGVEIIYYFTIRACCMLYKQRDELEKMASERKEKNSPRNIVPYFIPTNNIERAENILRQRLKDTKDMKIVSAKKLKPLMVKPSTKELIMPPFGIDYVN